MQKNVQSNQQDFNRLPSMQIMINLLELIIIGLHPNVFISTL